MVSIKFKKRTKGKKHHYIVKGEVYGSLYFPAELSEEDGPELCINEVKGEGRGVIFAPFDSKRKKSYRYNVEKGNRFQVAGSLYTKDKKDALFLKVWIRR